MTVIVTDTVVHLHVTRVPQTEKLWVLFAWVIIILYGRLVHFCCPTLSVWPCERSVANGFYFFSVFLLSLPIISASLSNICTVAVVAWNPVHTFSSFLYCALSFGWTSSLLSQCPVGRPRNRSSRATRSIQDYCRSTRSIDSTFDPSLDSTRLWSTAIDLINFLDVDVVELRAQADACMPASNNNVNPHYIH